MLLQTGLLRFSAIAVVAFLFIVHIMSKHNNLWVSEDGLVVKFMKNKSEVCFFYLSLERCLLQLLFCVGGSRDVCFVCSRDV